MQVDCRNGVDRARQMDIEGGLNRASTANQISPDVCHARDAQSKKATVSAESQRGLGLVVTPLVVRQKTLTTGRDPFHWAADMLRGPQNQRMFRISKVLSHKATT